MTFPASDPVAIGVPTSTEPVRASSLGKTPRPTQVVSGPGGPVAQHWIQLCVLPWAMWTAFGLMVTGWPLRQAWLAQRRISERNDDHLNS